MDETSGPVMKDSRKEQSCFCKQTALEEKQNQNDRLEVFNQNLNEASFRSEKNHKWPERPKLKRLFSNGIQLLRPGPKGLIRAILWAHHHELVSGIREKDMKLRKTQQNPFCLHFEPCRLDSHFISHSQNIQPIPWPNNHFALFFSFLKDIRLGLFAFTLSHHHDRHWLFFWAFQLAREFFLFKFIFPSLGLIDISSPHLECFSLCSSSFLSSFFVIDELLQCWVFSLEILFNSLSLCLLLSSFLLLFPELNAGILCCQIQLNFKCLMTQWKHLINSVERVFRPIWENVSSKCEFPFQKGLPVMSFFNKKEGGLEPKRNLRENRLRN